MRTHIEQEVLSHFGSETNLTSVSEQVGSNRQREKDKKSNVHKQQFSSDAWEIFVHKFKFYLISKYISAF